MPNQKIVNGYFGKIPAFPDFIKFNTGNNEIMMLDKWLQDGIVSAKRKLKSDWEKIYRNSKAFIFFYPFTDTDRFISGIIAPGNDSKGRNYPLIIFFIIKKKQIQKIPFYLVPLIFKDQYNDFIKIINGINDNISLNVLNERMSSTAGFTVSTQADELYQKYLHQTTQGDFWRKVSSNSVQDKKYRIAANIFNPEFRNSNAALKISISSEVKTDTYDISFLLNLISLARSNVVSPALFWSLAGSQNIDLYLFPSKPAAVNYLDLIYPDNENANILILDENYEQPRYPGKISDLIEKNEISLHEFLQNLSH